MPFFGQVSRTGIPPEVWDEVFKPRGPLGLASGSTVLGAIPGVGAGMSGVDLLQSLKEGSAIGTGGALLGMIPGGRGGKTIIDLLYERLRRGPVKEAERLLKYGPPGVKKQDIVPNSALEGYRAAVENWKARNKLADLQGSDDLTLSPAQSKKFAEKISADIDRITELQTNVEKRLFDFAKPGKLKHGKAKDLQSALKVFKDQLDKGGIPVEALEEADAVLGALDDAGVFTSTDQIIEVINEILKRTYTTP